MLKVHPWCRILQNVIPFLRLNNVLFYVYRPHLLVHSSVDRLLSFFRVLTIADKAAVNMGVQLSLRDPAFNSFGYRLRKIAGSYGNLIFNFLRYLILFFSTVGVPFYILPTGHKNTKFSVFSPS